MEYEDIPQIQVLRGGTDTKWCSVITCVRWSVSIKHDPDAVAHWVHELHTRPGLYAFVCHQKGCSVIFDICVHPQAPISVITDFQAFLAQGLKRLFGIKTEIVPYIEPQRISAH